MYILRDIYGNTMAEGESISYGDGEFQIGEIRFRGFAVAGKTLWKDGVQVDFAGTLAELECDYDNWKAIDKKRMTLIVKEINILREALGLPARTKTQVVEALKNE